MAITPKTVTLDVTTTEDHDEVASTYFKSGWAAALREVELNMNEKHLRMFLAEQARVMKENK